MRLWSAQTVSMFGTQVSRLAIPLIAILSLNASPAEVGIVAAAETLPYPLFGLWAGVLADRIRRRPILIWMDLGRAVLLGVVPVCWWLDLLSLPLLVALAFGVGTLSVFFDVAAQSYLPALVSRDRLVEANSKFALSGAGTRVVGPGFAGALIELLSAPFALGADAVSFLASGMLIARIREPETVTAQNVAERSVARDIRDGVGYVWRHPVLRPIAACTSTFNLAVGMFAAIFVLYATRDLEISPGVLGLIFAASGAGVLIGARLADHLRVAVGSGRAVASSVFVAAIGSLLVALAPSPMVLAAVVLGAGRVVYSIGTVMYDIIQVSLRQTVTPDELMGRMNATIRVAVWGTLPFGSLVGGFMGELVGLRPTLFVAVGGMFAASFWIVRSDVRNLHDVSTINCESA